MATAMPEIDIPFIVHYGVAFFVVLAFILTGAWVFRRFRQVDQIEEVDVHPGASA